MKVKVGLEKGVKEMETRVTDSAMLALENLRKEFGEIDE